ncbi:MAG: hypothetical protein ACPGTS_01455 [Minisyncoccia bacterium]
MRIINKVKENIKSFIGSSWLDELFWVSLLVFVAIGSFVLGMRHERENYLNSNPITITENSAISSAWQKYISSKKSSAEFFASKNGTVYYPLACPSGSRILEENRVYFAHHKEAQNAGYKISSRCN